MTHAIDITDRTDEAAIAALCTFGETVTTPAGSIEPTPAEFVLKPTAGKPRTFATAAGALEALRGSFFLF